MALEHAILVSLAERSASGYDLARRFDASIGHFWRASHQQIYKVLARMETDGWVASQVVPQDGRPDKKVYAITRAGRDELARWTSAPTPAEHLRSEFAVKLRALPFGDASAIVDDVRARRRAHVERLAYYEDSAARHYPRPDDLADAELGGWLVLRGGILSEQAGIAWCDEILQRLTEPADR
ncbi:PadR family transcriptional regulator [Aeromicrobium wangtongii]|uniref:PadR family transcriptional regulator n=1 Tax=Aeromicrobium wangtongii TaxID=2969247 RepID=A0ABY5M975_9ACTN|nr:PadR family transcriptional regulator [Aeromicrobium wangtongii]MCD9199310.1 PadR family transcriptional regulator [Aeromicrobium wangtongii]UUP13671.1 PadR family transcriptional regulator [Aeromicrobium wangtongii]